MLRIIDEKIFPALALAALVLFLVALWMIFFQAPVELTMGIVQKIFYVHVPAAMATYAGFIIAAIASMAFLFRPRQHWDIAARTGAELGLIFCAFVLFSGSLWGYKAWGTWWVWDPQLTATLILFLLYGGYVLLRLFGGNRRAVQRTAAVLAVVAVVNIPIIHYSVRLWGGIHPVVEREGGDGLAPEIAQVFGVSMLATVLVFAALLWLGFRVRLDELHLEVEDLLLLREEA